MSGTQLLRLRLNERLAAAVEEILGLVEKKMEQYEEEAIRAKTEITQLKQQIEHLTVFKPEVTSFRADAPLVFEVLPSQYPDPPPNAVENVTCDLQWIKKEPLDQWIKPEVEADASNEAEVRLEPDINDEPIPSSPAGTVSTNERDRSPLPLQQVDRCIVPDSQEDLKVPLPAHTHFHSVLFLSTVTLAKDSKWTRSSGTSSCGHATADHMEREHAPTGGTTLRFGGKVSSNSDLITHTNSHRGRKSFKCSECSRCFAHHGHIVTHMRIHTGEKPFRCSFCPRSFAQVSNLNVHLRTLAGEKPYFCRACGKMVTHSNHLKACGKKKYFKL